MLSKLLFLGKVVQKMVGWKLERTFQEADYLYLFQLGFRLGYSTERVPSLLLMICGGVVHPSWCSLIFQQLLMESFMASSGSIMGTESESVLQWFTSFLSDWFQLVDGSCGQAGLCTGSSCIAGVPFLLSGGRSDGHWCPVHLIIGLYMWMPLKAIWKLQLVQNATAWNGNLIAYLCVFVTAVM